jgi:hypothetical protein
VTEWKVDAEAKLAKELEALKQAHANVLTASENLVRRQRYEVKHVFLNHRVQTVVAPLKRKRSMLDDDDDREAVTTRASSAAPMTSAGAMDDSALANSDAPPSPKRSKGIATTAVQTATAITLGAVATWGVLAFS